MVHSVLASLVHSLCTSAADPLSDSEGVRRAATGECDVVVCLFVCLLTVRLTLHPTLTCSCSQCVQILHCVSLHAVRWQQSRAWDSPHLCMWAGRVYSFSASQCAHSTRPLMCPSHFPVLGTCAPLSGAAGSLAVQTLHTR